MLGSSSGGLNQTVPIRRIACHGHWYLGEAVHREPLQVVDEVASGAQGENWTVASTPGSSRGVVTLLDSFTEFTEEYELKMKEKGEQLIVRSFISATSPFLAFISATLPQSPHARRCLKI